MNEHRTGSAFDDDRWTAIACRAAGEGMPGSAEKELDRVLAAEPLARSVLEEAARAVTVLRAAALPAEAGRPERMRRLAEESARARGRRRLAAAAALLLAGSAALGILRSRVDTPPSGGRGSPAGTAAPFAEVFASLALPPGAPEEDLRVGATARGAPPAGGSALRPFAAQAPFPLLVPAELPPGYALVAARFRREGAAGRGFPLLWLHYSREGSPLVVIELPDGARGPEGLRGLELPAGFRAAEGTAAGVRALVAAPALSEEELRAVAASLAPIEE